MDSSLSYSPDTGLAATSGQSGAGAGNAEFEAFYQRHSREVWALVYARWLNADLAMDITQDTFLRLWKQLEKGERIESPRAWLLRVARNLAEDYGKSSFRRNGTHPPEVMNLVRAQHDSPLERLEREETFARLRESLAKLSIADRELLSYRYVLGYDAAKLAQLLSTSVTAIHMRLSRARQRLGERLTAEGIKLDP